MTRVQDSNGLDLTWLGLPRFGRDESQSVNKVPKISSGVSEYPFKRIAADAGRGGGAGYPCSPFQCECGVSIRCSCRGAIGVAVMEP